MTTIVKIGNKQVDFAKALPLTLGDVKALIRAGALGADGKPPSDGSVESAIQFISVLARKAEQSLTEADIDATPYLELTGVSKILETLLSQDTQSPLAG